MAQPVILSTKTLENHHKKRFSDNNLILIEDDFISIEFVPVDLNSIKTKPSLLLFTSQNAVKSIIENPNFNFLKNTPCVCVGSKTKELLESNRFKVLECENYADELAPILINNYSKENILFFSGNIRSDILPKAMLNHQINFEEVMVYKNLAKPAKINQASDAIIFLSPSAIKSYLINNTINHQICFCIGKSTAKALETITKKVVISNEQTIDSLIDSCINYYKAK